MGSGDIALLTNMLCTASLRMLVTQLICPSCKHSNGPHVGAQRDGVLVDRVQEGGVRAQPDACALRPNRIRHRARHLCKVATLGLCAALHIQ